MTASFLEEVYEKYGGLTAEESIALSMSEEPYKKARQGYNKHQPCYNKIKNKGIIEYYSKFL